MMEIEEMLGMLGKIDTARLRSQLRTLREMELHPPPDVKPRILLFGSYSGTVKDS